MQPETKKAQDAQHIRSFLNLLLDTEYVELAEECQAALDNLIGPDEHAIQNNAHAAASDVTANPRPKHLSDFSIQPVRIQYVKGQRMRSPNGLTCVYVGRPTPFGNPFKVGQGNTLTRAEAVDAFRKLLLARPHMMAQVRGKLRGKNLACWCPCDGEPCHADVLLEIANGSDPVTCRDTRRGSRVEA